MSLVTRTINDYIENLGDVTPRECLEALEELIDELTIRAEGAREELAESEES